MSTRTIRTHCKGISAMPVFWLNYKYIARRAGMKKSHMGRITYVGLFFRSRRRPSPFEKIIAVTCRPVDGQVSALLQFTPTVNFVDPYLLTTKIPAKDKPACRLEQIVWSIESSSVDLSLLFSGSDNTAHTCSKLEESRIILVLCYHQEP